MALYHLYRPQTFAGIIDQEHIVKTLENQIATGNTGHAYLFSGPRGIGKTSTARILAKAINCEKRKPGESEPCNACPSCEEIGSCVSLDVIEIDAASHTGVDNVRENIIENARFLPTKSRSKVFLIDEVHMLSGSAFNALLKTLEEPPARVVFILATTDQEKLPETIISRCQRFTFHKVPSERLKEHLSVIAKKEGVAIDDDVLERIAMKGDGSVRDAVSILDQLMSCGEKHITEKIADLFLPSPPAGKAIAWVASLIAKDQKEGIRIVNDAANDGIRLPDFCAHAIELLRAMLILSVSRRAPFLDLSKETKKKLESLGSSVTPQECIALIDILMKRRLEIKASPLPQLPLELAVVEWCMRNTIHDTRNTTQKKQELTVTETSSPTQSETQKDTEEPVKKTVTQRVKEIIFSEPAVPIETVQKEWASVLTRLETISPSLVFLLKMATVEGVKGKTIDIAVPFPFHRDRILQSECKKQIESALSAVFNTALSLDVVINETEGSAEEEEKNINELAAALGGEVVQ